jgi:hypothetical protein
VTAAHGKREKRNGQRDSNWPNWYAANMMAGRDRAADVIDYRL